MKVSIETRLNDGLCKLYKGFIGQGPKSIKTRIFQDMIIIRFKTYPDPFREHLAETPEGVEVIKRATELLQDAVRKQLMEVICSIVNCEVKEIHFSRNAVTRSEVYPEHSNNGIINEEIVVTVILREDLEARLSSVKE